MADNSIPGLGDLMALFGGSNPLAGIGKSIAQFQRGVNEFLSGVENFNATMAQLNVTAARINGLLDTVEEPIKAFVPQMTRSIKAADRMVEQLSGPIERVAPGLSQLADTLAAPALRQLPAQMGSLVDVFNDLVKRMQPMAQMAESAGSLFGFRPLAALRSGGGRPADIGGDAPSPSVKTSAAAAASTKKPSASKPAAKKPAAKKPAAKKPAAKKPAPSKAVAGRSASGGTSKAAAAKSAGKKSGR